MEAVQSFSQNTHLWSGSLFGFVLEIGNNCWNDFSIIECRLEYLQSLRLWNEKQQQTQNLKTPDIFFIPFLKVTFHLQFLQNIGSIPRVAQYILEPILHPVVCTSHPQTYILLPPPPLPTGNH